LSEKFTNSQNDCKEFILLTIKLIGRNNYKNIVGAAYEILLTAVAVGSFVAELSTAKYI
jgi:hypothetical protein